MSRIKTSLWKQFSELRVSPQTFLMSWRGWWSVASSSSSFFLTSFHHSLSYVTSIRTSSFARWWRQRVTLLWQTWEELYVGGSGRDQHDGEERVLKEYCSGHTAMNVGQNPLLKTWVTESMGISNRDQWKMGTVTKRAFHNIFSPCKGSFWKFT